MRRSTIVDTTARLIFHSALMLSLYLLVAGHNQPGGGFLGGLVCGAAVAVHYIAGGIKDVRRISRLAPWDILGGGLMLATGAALVPLFVGGSVLESASVKWDVGVLGTIKVASTLIFDTGVYAIVVGLVFMVFEAFGEESPAPENAEAGS